MKKLRVAVLMGGESSEREVSLSSGTQIISNLDRGKYEVVAVDVPTELSKLEGCEVALIALHGKGGEDGMIQGYLETLGIKYTGCGVLASAVGMDKLIFRRVAESLGIIMPKISEVVPCVVKPVDGGSSVGVSIVKKKSELAGAIKLAKKYGSKVMIEEYIKGVEVSCGVLGNDSPIALPVIEIVPKKDFFDYEAKYALGMSEEICPARITKKVSKQIQEASIMIFKAIGGRGFARVDFIIRDEVPYMLEINTIPGMTPNSLLPKEAKVAGLSYAELLDRMIELALEKGSKN